MSGQRWVNRTEMLGHAVVNPIHDLSYIRQLGGTHLVKRVQVFLCLGLFWSNLKKRH